MPITITPPATSAATAACCAPLAAPRLTQPEAEQIAALLKALADPARVRLVNLLATSPEPICVCDFTQPLGLSQPTVSHHLHKLREAGLVHVQRRGTWAYYWLDRDAMNRLTAILDLDLRSQPAGERAGDRAPDQPNPVIAQSRLPEPSRTGTGGTQ